jgi:hypothetical protein
MFLAFLSYARSCARGDYQACVKSKETEQTLILWMMIHPWVWASLNVHKNSARVEVKEAAVVVASCDVFITASLPQECMLSRNAKCPWTSRIMRMMAHSHQS